MNGVDYTKKFAEVTSDYRDTLDRKNKAHKNELDRLKANHDHVQKTQSKNLDNARAKMQKNYEDRVNTISEETRNTISEKSKQYNDALSSERERFMQDRARINTDFSKRITDLSKSFKDAQDAKDRSHAESMNSAKERYREGLDQKQKEFNDKVVQFQNASKKGLKDTQDLYNAKLKEVNTRNADDKLDSQIDNNRRLGKLRDDLSGALNKAEANYKGRMREFDDHNRSQRAKQVNAINEERRSLKESFDRDSRIQKLASEKAMNEARDTFVKKIDDVKQANYESDRYKTMKHHEHTNRMKDGYQNLINNERKVSKDRADFDRKSYNERVQKLTNEYHSNIDKMREKSIGAGSLLSKQFQEKKADLVNKHAKDMQSLVSKNTKQNNLLKTKINDDVEKLRKAQQTELESTREVGKRRFDAMRMAQNEQIKENFNMFKEMNKNLVDKTAESNAKLNREMSERISDLNTKHTKDMRDYKRKLATYSKDGDAYAQIREEQEQSTEKKLYERKVEQFKKEIADVEADYKNENKEMHRKFEKDLTEKTQRYASELKDVKNENNINRLNDRISMKKKIDFAERKFEEKSRIESQDFEAEMRAQKRNEKEKISKLKENFNRTFVDLNHKKELHVQELKDDYSRDKKVFMSNVTKQNEDEKYRMRKDFDVKLNKVITSYERELDKLRNENSMVKRQMEDEINLARQKAQKLISIEKDAMTRKSRENMKIAKDEKDRRERELIAQIDRIHDNYGKKLNDQNYQSNLKLETLTREYEFKLDNVKKEAAATVALKESQVSKEEQRLKTAFENEKRRIVEQFESQINNMRTSHRDQINRLADYKSAELSRNS